MADEDSGAGGSHSLEELATRLRAFSLRDLDPAKATVSLEPQSREVQKENSSSNLGLRSPPTPLQQEEKKPPAYPPSFYLGEQPPDPLPSAPLTAPPASDPSASPASPPSTPPASAPSAPPVAPPAPAAGAAEPAAGDSQAPSPRPGGTRLYRRLADGRRVYFQRLDKSDPERVSQVFALVRRAEQEGGQSFGTGNCGSEERFRSEVKDACCLLVLDGVTGSLAAVLLVTPCRFYRGEDVAEPYIVVCPQYRGKGLGQLCLRVCLQLAKSLRFIGLYADVLSDNAPMLRIVSKFHFREVARLPFGGRTLGDKRVVSLLVFYMELPSYPRLQQQQQQQQQQQEAESKPATSRGHNVEEQRPPDCRQKQ